MKKVFVPNYTMIPNSIIESMSEMTECEFRVVVAVARKTFGWQKKKDRISLSQLKELTGLSTQGVIDGVNKAIENEWITRYPVGQSFEYEVLVNVVDELEEKTSQRSREVLVNVVDRFDGQLVNVVDTQKKELNKKKENNTTADALSPDLSAVIRCYESNIGAATGIMLDEFRLALTEYPLEWIEAAVSESVKHNARKWPYVLAVLKTWKRDGFKADNRNKKLAQNDRSLPFNV